METKNLFKQLLERTNDVNILKEQIFKEIIESDLDKVDKIHLCQYVGKIDEYIIDEVVNELKLNNKLKRNELQRNVIYTFDSLLDYPCTTLDISTEDFLYDIMVKTGIVGFKYDW